MSEKAKEKGRKIAVTAKPSPEYIIFSYKYLSNNKSFGLPAFDSVQNSAAALESLIEKQREISAYHLAKLRMLGKIRGSEPIPLKQFNKSLQGVFSFISIIDKESKMDVIRFGSQDYRMICKSDPVHGNILHVIAFDLNFTAYDHG